MTRIAENQLARRVLGDISDNRALYNKYSEQVSSGLKVTEPGDSKFASTIAAYRETLSRIEGHKTRISAVQAQVSYQDNVMQQVSDLLVRAQELATQAANETIGAEVRSQMAKEVFEIRNHIVNLANTQYQGKYIYGGAVDDQAPYSAQTYTNPASGAAAQRYLYLDTTANPAAALTRTVNLTDEVSLVVNTPGNQIFDNSIQALERLGRALQGYRTEPDVGVPDGTGTAYTLPADTTEQTTDIQNALTLIKRAREEDVMPERVSLGARLRRIETAESMLELTKADAQEVLSGLQDADYATAATSLSQAQTALEASFTVSSRVLKLSILDYL